MGRDDSREVPIFRMFQDPFTKFDREKSKVKDCSVAEAQLQSSFAVVSIRRFCKSDDGEGLDLGGGRGWRENVWLMVRWVEVEVCFGCHEVVINL